MRESFGIDELGFVDDAIDFLMPAHELEEAQQARALGGDLVGRGANARRDMVADLVGHVADQRAEDRVLRIEIGVETAQRDPGAARDPADRSVVKPLFAELDSAAASSNARKVRRPRSVRGALPALAVASSVAGRVRSVAVAPRCTIFYASPTDRS